MRVFIPAMSAVLDAEQDELFALDHELGYLGTVTNLHACPRLLRLWFALPTCPDDVRAYTTAPERIQEAPDNSEGE